MIVRTRRLVELEDRYLRDTIHNLTYEEALDLFEALWVEALLLNPYLGEDWYADLEPDFAVARAVNGLSPAA